MPKSSATFGLGYYWCSLHAQVLGFNLSFFADEHELVGQYLSQVNAWVASGQIRAPRVTSFVMEDVPQAHGHIQSGKSVGKIIVRTSGAPGATSGATEKKVK